VYSVKVFRKCTKEIVDYWAPLFGLGDWKIRVKFTERKEFATCNAQPEYEEADIYVNTKDLRCKSKEYILDTIIHEMAHIGTWIAGHALDEVFPQRNPEDPPLSELLTTQYARSMRRAHQAGFDLAEAEEDEEE
jgi:predicted SprT family Zn-dependent metalloprotease